MFKIRNYVNSKILRPIYFAIFESHLNLKSSLVWAQHSDSIKCLIILQKKVLRIINFEPRNCHTSRLFKENAILKLINKVQLENILFVNKCINNLLPPIFNDWFTFISAPHQTISYSKNSIKSSSIQSWNNAQQKLRSLKTLPSTKIKQLIADEILKNYYVYILYSIKIS